MEHHNSACGCRDEEWVWVLLDSGYEYINWLGTVQRIQQHGKSISYTVIGALGLWLQIKFLLVCSFMVQNVSDEKIAFV